jgi:hypothetical protein
LDIAQKVQDLQEKIAHFEQILEIVQQKNQVNPESTKRRRRLSVEIDEEEQNRNKEEFSKIWTTISNLVTNTHEQFDKIRNEIQSTPKNYKSSRSSSRDFDMPINKNITTFVEEIREQLFSEIAEVNILHTACHLLSRILK